MSIFTFDNYDMYFEEIELLKDLFTSEFKDYFKNCRLYHYQSNTSARPPTVEAIITKSPTKYTSCLNWSKVEKCGSPVPLQLFLPFFWMCTYFWGKKKILHLNLIFFFSFFFFTLRCIICALWLSMYCAFNILFQFIFLTLILGDGLNLYYIESLLTGMSNRSFFQSRDIASVVIRTNIASFNPGWKLVLFTFMFHTLFLPFIHLVQSSGVIHPYGSENRTWIGQVPSGYK